MLTSRITMMLVHKVLDCVQVAIGAGQREWSVTSLVNCTCAYMHACMVGKLGYTI